MKYLFLLLPTENQLLPALVAELLRDRGALINVDTPGCGTSVVRGPTGHK